MAPYLLTVKQVVERHSPWRATISNRQTRLKTILVLRRQSRPLIKVKTWVSLSGAYMNFTDSSMNWESRSGHPGVTTRSSARSFRYTMKKFLTSLTKTPSISLKRVMLRSTLSSSRDWELGGPRRTNSWLKTYTSSNVNQRRKLWSFSSLALKTEC
jgi:hypothetical protein